jgi:thymidylate kinase
MSIYFIDGADGTGKTTAIKKISMMTGVPFVKLPYGSDGDSECYSGKKLREILNNKDTPCDPVALQALMFVNKLEAIKVIKELENEHGVVLVDRSHVSGLVYGEVDGVDCELSKWMYNKFEQEFGDSHFKIFIFDGESFKQDSDIYCEKQESIKTAFRKYLWQQRDNPNVIEISVLERTEDNVAFEVLSHIVKDVMKNSLTIDAAAAKLGGFLIKFGVKRSD